MRRAGRFVRGFVALLSVVAACGASAGGAADSCEREANWVPSEGTRHFMVLAASSGVFHDRSGPSFVMLMRADRDAEQLEMGAVGIYADDESRAVFGAVPWQTYDAFLREPEKDPRRALLRLEISEPQYERVLRILHTWARRARENELLYPDDVFMNNILLVKQATEALNRCREAIKLYKLDWSLEDHISENNPSSHVPLLALEELRRRNPTLHVPDNAMPEEVLAVAGSEPLAPREVPQAKESDSGRSASVPSHDAHEHHHHHAHEGHAHGSETQEGAAR